MLKKLIAHEWHDCWRLMAVVNGLVLLLSVIGLFVFNQNWYEAFGGADGSNPAAVGFVLYSILFFISIGALSFVVNLYFYIRFYRNLYTDQGYLMQTLPVTPSMLILSKSIVAVIWNIISVVVVLVSVAVIGVGFIGVVENQTLWTAFQDIMNEITWPKGFGFVVFAVIVLILVSAVLNIMLGYTAVSVGQLFRKQKVLAAIGAYVVIYIIIQTVSSFASIGFPIWFGDIEMNDAASAVGAVLLIISAIMALVDVGLYFINEYIMKNKLNLD